MNVQTLPPGYKTAPWTPPETITAAMLSEASARLIDLLRIRTQPIGMRLFRDPADMETIKGLRRPTEGFKFTMPGWWQLRFTIDAPPGRDEADFNIVL